LLAVRGSCSAGGGKTFFLIGGVDCGVVASSDVNRQTACEKHVGVVGIIVKRGFSDLGIGTAIMRALLEQAQEMGLRVLALSAFGGVSARSTFTRMLGSCRLALNRGSI
jgi:ribosomal protein S18 acetylase RimI-like enzyme